MAKFRVYEIAKKYNKDNKEILEILKANHVEVKNHMSTIGDEQIKMIENALKPKKEAKQDHNSKKQENSKRKDNKKAQNMEKKNNKKTQEVKNNKNNSRNKNNDGDKKILRKDNPQNSQKFGKNNKKNKKFNNKNQNQNQEHKKKKKTSGPGAFIKPEPVKKPEVDPNAPVKIPPVLTLKELADALSIPANDIIKKLLISGAGMLNVNSELDFEKAEEIAMEFDRLVEMEEQVDVIEELLKEEEEDETDMIVRPPVVCVMGHVDHGKTSLLDKIRSSHVTTGEAGGITQHIGAYVVETSNGKITFLDTPGHEAFTSMRMRGAQSTDIAILVVAADDGVMPQTIEAINHAKAAGIEIIVAINKIDKESANIERVKQELIEYELVPEDWGGSTIFCPVSAHTGEGIDELLDMVSLTAEVLELKANPNRKARGIVLEAQLDKGRGPVATVLVQKGTLHVGDAVAIGSAHGKVRAMINDKGKRIKTAGPSTPVEILGLSEVPNAGEVMMVMDSEKEARSVAEKFIAYGREKMLSETKQQLSLDDLFNQIQAGSVKELNIIVKADVQGSVEAVKQSLVKLSNDEVAVKVIHGGVGAITESDVNLAAASNAIIIGFNVRPEPAAKDAASAEKVDLRLYRVIYNAIEDIEAAMKGMLDPEFVEKVTGHAEVRQIFKASGVGTIAGSYVLDGTIQRDSSARIIRDGIVVHEGKLASIQRGKDAVKEVRSGFECGLVMESYNDIKEGDQIESFIMEEVQRYFPEGSSNMRKNSIKNTRINGEVQRELSRIISREIKDPRIAPMTSVVDAVVTSDLKQCKAYISVLGNDEEKEETMKGLNSAVGYIRRELAHSINLRNTPEITFILDDSIEYGVNMSKKIDELNHGSENETL